MIGSSPVHKRLFLTFLSFRADSFGDRVASPHQRRSLRRPPSGSAGLDPPKLPGRDRPRRSCRAGTRRPGYRARRRRHGRDRPGAGAAGLAVRRRRLLRRGAPLLGGCVAGRPSSMWRHHEPHTDFSEICDRLAREQRDAGPHRRRGPARPALEDAPRRGSDLASVVSAGRSPQRGPSRLQG
jgi:hypothetical protein